MTERRILLFQLNILQFFSANHKVEIILNVKFISQKRTCIKLISEIMCSFTMSYASFIIQLVVYIKYARDIQCIKKWKVNEILFLSRY